MNGLSKRSLSELKGIDSVLIDIIKEGVKYSPFDFGIPDGGGFRTDKDQIEMYAIGRTTELHRSPVTWTLNSYHKTGKAFDVYAYVDGRASWEMQHIEPIARHLQKVAMEMFCVELDWGFDLWGRDGSHFQVK